MKGIGRGGGRGLGYLLGKKENFFPLLAKLGVMGVCAESIRGKKRGGESYKDG